MTTFSGSSIAVYTPLVVDLDGTLIKSDLLYESTTLFLAEKPFQVFKLLVWLAKGKSVLKSHLAQAVHIDMASLPYNSKLIEWIREERAEGRPIVLATASHQLLANRVAGHLGVFDEVLATDLNTNLKAEVKREALVARYGEGGFDYVGNDWSDIPVWQSAAQAHVVSPSKRLINKVRAHGNLGRVIDVDIASVSSGLIRAMRPHQWIKNLLTFIPLMAAHRFVDSSSVVQAFLAFVVFCLTASSVYLLNDLVDLHNDRLHPRKRHRPFASGHLGIGVGWVAWPLLLWMALTLAYFTLPWKFTVALSFYFVLTLAYSLRLKQVPVVDALVLAALYTLRVIAGAAAIGVALSFWLLSFSIFLFLSLAYIKRYSELRTARDIGESGVLRGRGYEPQDLELVSSLGGTAGYISVLVLALYIQDAHTASLYATPAIIWLACPLLLFWISRAWLLAHRGHMHDDPVVFALNDRTSWTVLGLFALVFAMAKVVA
jgi:4-hydroxybenzoate polyprenyltransferase/phosphoserine phosphatase